MNPSDADRNVGVDGNVDKSVIVTGDNNSVSYVTMQAIKKHCLVVAIALMIVSVSLGAWLIRGQKRQETATEGTAAKLHEMSGQIAKASQDLQRPEVLEGLIKAKIREEADLQIALIQREPDYNWRDVDAIEKRRDAQLELVEGLVANLQTRLAGDVDPVFAEAAKLLADKGVDEAIEYLTAKRAAIFREVEQINSRQNIDETEKRTMLESVLLDATLRQARLEWEEAVELYEEVLKRAPNWGRVHGDLGTTLFRLQKFEAAERSLDKARVLAPDGSVEKAEALNALVLTRLNSGRPIRLGDTERRINEALQIDRGLLNNPSEDGRDSDHAAVLGEFRVARDLTTLATVKIKKGEFADAISLMDEAVEHTRNLRGDDLHAVATVLTNQANLLLAVGAVDVAEDKMRAVLAIDRELDSSNGQNPSRIPHHGIHLSNLAVLLGQTGRLTEAEWLFHAAIEHNEELYGPGHVHLARDLFSLAETLGLAGRLDQSGLLTTRALILAHRGYGDRHPFVGTCLRGTGNWFLRNGQFPESAKFLTNAIQIHETAGEARALELLNDFNSLAMVLQDYSIEEPIPPYVYFATAESLFRRSLNGWEQVFSRDHPEYKTCLDNLKQLLFEFRLAGPVESQRDQDVLQPTDANGLNSRGLIAFRRGSYDDAYVLFRRAMQEASLDSTLAEASPAVRMNEAMALRELDRIAPAIQRLQSLLDDLSNDPSSTFARGRTSYHLAVSHWYLHDPEAAIESCKASIAAYQEITGEFEALTRMTNETVALRQKLENGEKPEPMEPLDVTQLVKDAEERFDELHDLSFDFDKSAAGMLRKVHGDVLPLEELLSEITRVVKEAGPDGRWLIAPDEPVSPHLDDFLGEIPDDAIERIIATKLPVGRDVD